MTNEEINYNQLKEFALSRGIVLFGVSLVSSLKDEIHSLPSELVKKFKYVISIAVHLSDTVFESLDNEPTQLYKYHYKVANHFLDNITFLISSEIQEKGFSALPVPASQVIDWEKELATVSHRAVAYFAGVGFYGRNNLMVNPRYGARIRLASVFTDLPLKTDEPLVADCGECRLCIQVCPAGAIGEYSKLFDRKKCSEQLKIFSSKLKLGVKICGLCIKVCRKNRE